MNKSRKHLKSIYIKYMTDVINKNGITLDVKTLRRLNSKDKKHVKYLLNTLYGYGLDFERMLDEQERWIESGCMCNYNTFNF